MIEHCEINHYYDAIYAHTVIWPSSGAYFDQYINLLQNFYNFYCFSILVVADVCSDNNGGFKHVLIHCFEYVDVNDDFLNNHSLPKLASNAFFSDLGRLEALLGLLVVRVL